MSSERNPTLKAGESGLCRIREHTRGQTGRELVGLLSIVKDQGIQIPGAPNLELGDRLDTRLLRRRLLYPCS